MMVTRKSASPLDHQVTPESVANPTVPSPAYGPDHSFTLQVIMELQKSVVEMSANLQAMKGTLDGVKVKVEDLVNWKHKILGGAAVAGAVIAGGGFLLAKAWDHVTLKNSGASPPQIGPTVPAATPSGPKK
jgi:hypothetical protein